MIITTTVINCMSLLITKISTSNRMTLVDVCQCVITDSSAHLKSALQGPERVRLLIDDRVLVASNERLPEVVVRKRLLVANQRNAPFLYIV